MIVGHDVSLYHFIANFLYAKSTSLLGFYIRQKAFNTMAFIWHASSGFIETKFNYSYSFLLIGSVDNNLGLRN